MKGYIEAGRVILEMSADELRTLYIAVDHEVGHHIGMAAEYESGADGREQLARRVPRGRTMNRRLAGELRDKAACHKACARDAGDLRRVLEKLTRSPDPR